MSILTIPSTPLSGVPTEIVVTDFALHLKPLHGRPVGEIWYSTDLGVCSCFVHDRFFGKPGDSLRLFQFSHRPEPYSPSLPYEFELTLALKRYLESLPSVICAPVISRDPKLQFDWVQEVVTYGCPLCAMPHAMVMRVSDPQTRQKPPCQGLTTLWQDLVVPDIELGDDIDTAAYEAGTLVLRLSRQIQKSTQGDLTS